MVDLCSDSRLFFIQFLYLSGSLGKVLGAKLSLLQLAVIQFQPTPTDEHIVRLLLSAGCSMFELPIGEVRAAMG